MFWDSSAIVPCIVSETYSSQTIPLLLSDPATTLWWAAVVECVSALEQKRRDIQHALPWTTYVTARRRLDGIMSAADVVLPTGAVRAEAVRLLERHPLRAADALQLAAALVSGQRELVCFDVRLNAAAASEGLRVRP